MLTGGVSIGPQIASMEKGAHVVVGTPGRILDHLRKGTLAIDQLQTLVLDEADRMLDMGFNEDIQSICHHTPASRQTLLFSATFPTTLKAQRRFTAAAHTHQSGKHAQSKRHRAIRYFRG